MVHGAGGGIDTAEIPHIEKHQFSVAAGKLFKEIDDVLRCVENRVKEINKTVDGVKGILNGD